jgi:hypothetical protein
MAGALITCQTNGYVYCMYSSMSLQPHILLGMALVGKESLLASPRTSDGETSSCRILSTQIVHEVRLVRYIHSRLSNMKFLYLGSSMFMS